MTEFIHPTRVFGRQRRHGLGRKTKRVERFLEAMAIRRLGWNVDLFRGDRLPDTGPIEPYRIVHPAYTLPRRRHEVFDTIVVGAWGRFGNSTEQLGNAVEYARLYGARRILVPPGHTIFQPPASVEGLTFDLGSIATLGTRETALVGRFFLCPASAHRPALQTRYANASRYARSLIQPEILKPDERVAADDVVAYVRSSDVFTRSPPNPEYGQPPLEFYRAAIRDLSARRVWLVYEDLASPIISVLSDHLQSEGVEVVHQSGTLVEDFRVLLSARRLIVGVSTLINVVIALSPRLSELHLFGDQVDLRPPGAAIRLHRTIDRSGFYVNSLQKDKWRNDEEQRRLMLTYPADQLVITRDEPKISNGG